MRKQSNAEQNSAYRWLRRVPGFLPIRLQNFLHRWQPGLRTLQIISELNAAPCLVQGAVLLSMQKRKVGIHADT